MASSTESGVPGVLEGIEPLTRRERGDVGFSLPEVLAKSGVVVGELAVAQGEGLDLVGVGADSCLQVADLLSVFAAVFFVLVAQPHEVLAQLRWRKPRGVFVNSMSAGSTTVSPIITSPRSR